MQDDARLCLYSGSGPDAGGGSPLWQSLAQPQDKARYFAVMQEDGNFCAYHGDGPNRTGHVWSTSGAVPGGEYFVAVEDGGQITVNKGNPATPGQLVWAARHRLRILTYNTHLMQDSNLVVGAWFKNKKPVCFQDSRRHAFIVEKIRQSGADIVALQEVWSKRRMREFHDQLRSVYPYCAFGADGDNVYDYATALIDFGDSEARRRFWHPAAEQVPARLSIQAFREPHR